MLRSIAIIGVLALLLPGSAFAITPKEKMETCKFGADDQKLKAGKRTAFIKRCMAEEKEDATPKPVAAPKPPKPSSPPKQDGAQKSSAGEDGPRFPNVKE